MLDSISAKYLILLFMFSLTITRICSVTDVTSENFHEFMNSPVVLLEFYAPWCKHCIQFENIYNQIGKTLNSYNIKAGKCDSSENQALAARFNIHQIPTLFLIRSGKVWIYDGALSHDKVVDFVMSEYKTQNAMSFTESPMGPVGKFKGLLIRVGIFLYTLPNKISAYSGFSYSTSIAITAIIMILLILFLIFSLVYITLVKQKYD